MAIDINNIKTQFKSIFDSANTTTADYDLSTGMNNRVQKVLKLNPLKIPIQPSFFPYVTIYPDTKDIELVTIAKNQQIGKRMAELSFNVIGAVWEQLISDITADDADDEIENLMENVEEVLRRNFKLNDSVKWTIPESTSYHALPLDEETHMRVGLLTLNAKIEY